MSSLSRVRVPELLPLLAVVSLLAANADATASVQVSFSVTESRGSSSTDTDFLLEEVTGGVKFSVTVNDPVNTSDLSAVYFNLVGDPPIDLNVTGPGVVTDFGTFENNIQTGNIGETFDVGVAIGNPGSGSDFFDAFMFTVSGTGIDLNSFLNQTFAVRGQTVGPPPNGGGGSSKEFGTSPMTPDPMTPPDPDPMDNPEAPEPTSMIAWLGLVGIATMKRRQGC